MRPILCYKAHQEAEKAIGALLASEIQAQLSEHSDNDGGTMSCVSVAEPEENDAIKLVEDKQLTTDAVRCPSCDSANVEYPSAPQASPTMKLADQVMNAVTGNKHKFFCRSCSHVWS